MKTIITIQHTESMHHTNGMVGSWTDWDLSEKGTAQAKKIGKNLKEELSGAEFVIYSSDLKRASQTAMQVGACLGIEPVLRTELRERNLGRCCGKSVAWLRENMEMEEKTIDDRLFSDGESRRDEYNRLLPFFREIMENDEEHIIIVSHGDLLGVFNTMFLDLPPESLNALELSGVAGGVSFFFIDDNGKRKIRRLSDLSYKK